MFYKYHSICIMFYVFYMYHVLLWETICSICIILYVLYVSCSICSICIILYVSCSICTCSRTKIAVMCSTAACLSLSPQTPHPCLRSLCLQVHTGMKSHAQYCSARCCLISRLLNQSGLFCTGVWHKQGSFAEEPK